MFTQLLPLLLILVIIGLVYLNMRTKRKLQHALANASRYARLKNEFVAGMSHEIRTPMSTLIGFTEQLSKTKLTQTQQEYAEAINFSAGNLLGIVNNVLDYSKLENDPIQLSQHNFQPLRILQIVMIAFENKAKDKGIHLELSTDIPLDKHICGDSHRLRQILFHILDNAVKFTHTGSIRVQAGFEQHLKNPVLSVRISDTGIGIGEHYLPHIFDAFSQATDLEGKIRQASGTGLGLTIVQKLVEVHKGKIQVHSQLGTGTNVEIQLPYLPAQANMMLISSDFFIPQVEDSFRVLIAEDNPLNLRLLELILHKMEIRCLTATNGQEALDLIGEQRIDMLLTDIQMPEMDGLTLLKKVRSLPDPYQSQIPIIAISGNAVSEAEINSYLSSGMDGYILKPFKEKEIIEVIYRNIPLSVGPS